MREERETARIERKQELKEALDEQSDKLERRIVKTMTDKVVEKVVTQLKGTIEEEVIKATEPVRQNLERNEEILAKLKKDMDALKAKVDNKENESNENETDFPALPRTEKPVHMAATWTEDNMQNRVEDKTYRKDEEEIRNILKKAKSAITFGPNTEEDFREIVSKLERDDKMDKREAEDKALQMMIIEFFELEMMMKKEHIDVIMKEHVKEIYPKTRTNWKAIVVKFHSEDIVDWIMRGKGKMRQGIEGSNKPVAENFVPGGMYRRYNAVKSIAYRIRHNEGLQTKITFGHTDICLVTSKRKEDFWGEPIKLTNLPDFQVRSLNGLDREKRTPSKAPGRERYGGTTTERDKRPLSLSPGNSPASKQTRQDNNAVSSESEREEIENVVTTRARGSRGKK